MLRWVGDGRCDERRDALAVAMSEICVQAHHEGGILPPRSISRWRTFIQGGPHPSEILREMAETLLSRRDSEPASLQAHRSLMERGGESKLVLVLDGTVSIRAPAGASSSLLGAAARREQAARPQTQQADGEGITLVRGALRPRTPAPQAARSHRGC